VLNVDTDSMLVHLEWKGLVFERGVFMTNLRQEVRDFLNKRVGSIIAVQDFSKPTQASHYLYMLCEDGNVERIERGIYKVLKKVELKKKGPPKGYKSKYIKPRSKDLSKLPAILNSSKQGLVLLEIEQAYQKVTPVQKQVSRNYLYRFFCHAKKKGIIKHNGTNKLMRVSDIGPLPKRLVLTNKDITEEEWDLLVQDYVKWYSGKKSTKSKRTKKPVSGSVGMKSVKIINNFTQLRANPNKNFVENHFLITVKQYTHGQKINCLSVTGPDYNRHIEKLFSTIAKKVYVVEGKKGVFQKIYNKALVCPNYINGNVDLIKADLLDVIIPDCQYVDLDLMGSLKGQINIITRYMSIQLHYFLPETIKFLTFTASTRNDGGPSERFKILQTIFQNAGLNAELEGDELFGNKIPMGSQEHTQLKFCYKHIPVISNYGRIIDAQVFTYQDTSPMLSVLFVYK